MLEYSRPVFFAFIVSLLGGCGASVDEGGGNVSSSESKLDGNWMAQRIVSQGEAYPEAKLGTVKLTFGNGSYTATAGCNSGGGSFSLEGDQQLRLIGDGWTEMGCDDPVANKLESVLIQLLGRIDSYSIEEDQITLSDGSEDNLLVLVPTPPVESLSLLKTRWILQTFEQMEGEGESASVSATPVIGDKPIDLIFDDESASGSGGCNRFSAPVKIENETISFSDVISTRMACTPEVMKQESRFYSTLGKITRYEIVGNQLRLSNDNSTIILHFTGEE